MGKHQKRHSCKTEVEGGIILREIRPGYWMADYQRDGLSRVRKCFSDLTKARAWASTESRVMKRHGTTATNFTADQRREYDCCMGLLKGTGYTLRACVEDYLRRHPATGGQTVRETCDAYLQAMKDLARRELSIKDKGWKFNLLCEKFGKRLTVGLELEEIETWAKSRGTSDRTAAAHIGAAQDLMRFFARKNKLHGKPLRDEEPPCTWDAGMVKRVLTATEQHAPHVAAGMAILFFAGLRPNEMTRLDWSAIDLTSGLIRLTGAATKTRSGRNVTITANLHAWLTTYRSTGQVVPNATRFRNARVLVTKKVGLRVWPVDVSRHSFATAHLHLNNDAAATSIQLGHKGNGKMLENHYRGVPITQAEAQEYFAVMPEKQTAAIIFSAAG